MPAAQAALSLIDDARRNERQALDEFDAKRLLSLYGLCVPRSVYLERNGSPAHAPTDLRWPVVLKVASRDLLHKSDIGGVRLGLKDPAEVHAAMDLVAANVHSAGHRVDGFLVEEMASPGHEVVIGGFVDPSFGPIVMIGLGGVFIEVLGDVAFRICPITRGDAAEMIDDLQGAAVLRGARGGTLVPDSVLIDALMAVGGPDSLLVDLADEVSELDINPLIVSSNGAVAVDARVILADRRRDAA